MWPRCSAGMQSCLSGVQSLSWSMCVFVVQPHHDVQQDRRRAVATLSEKHISIKPHRQASKPVVTKLALFTPATCYTACYLLHGLFLAAADA
jgi:hypothetical protein